jgi:hypothetical protein
MSDENAMVGTADRELFNDAMTAETPQDTAKVNVDQPLLDQAAVARDEHGRFAPKEQEQPKAEEDQPQPNAERKEPPEFRFREVSEAKRAAEERANALEAQVRQLMALIPQNRPQQTQEAPKVPEIWDDPEQWAQHKLGTVGDEVRQTREFFSRRLAEQTHGAEKVAEAYQALDAAISSGRLSRDAVMADLSKSMDPYGAIMDWHRSQVTQQKVGNDPDAFFSRTLEEKLSDPAFAASLVEKLTGQARQQPNNGNGRPAIDIPPSLSRMTTAAPATGAQGDMTDASIFQNALS